MKSYTVIHPVKTDKGIHQPGETIELSDKDGADLKSSGVVSEIAAPAEPAVPTDPAERQALIIEAIGKLDPQDPDLWLKDNRPDIAAIAAITGWPLSAAERNDAWESMQAAA